jgi:hypothetical protein
MLLIEDIKNEIEKRIKIATIEPNQDGRMLIGEEFYVRRYMEVANGTLVSLLKWIEDESRP